MKNFFKKNKNLNTEQDNNVENEINNVDNNSKNRDYIDEKNKLIDMDEIESLIYIDKNSQKRKTDEPRKTKTTQTGKSKRADFTNLDDKEKIKQQKRSKAWQMKMRRRRIAFVIIVVALIILIVKLISTFVGRNQKSTVQPKLASWYVGEIFRENNKDYTSSIESPKNETDRMMLAYSRASGINKRIMPGSNHLVSASSYAYDTKEIREYIRGEAEYQGREKLVFLTFDDGPNTTVTPQILNILKKNDVHATFFTVGKNIVESNYGVLEKTLMDGNSLGLHSFSHDYDLLYPEKTGDTEQILEEARLTAGRLEKVFGEDFKATVWRYPGGHLSWQGLNESDEQLKAMGIEWIDWNSLSGDSEKKSLRPSSVEEEVNYIIKTLNQNLHSDVAVVLMHDATDKQLTVDSLQSVIDYFKENNYKFGILK